MVMAVADGKVTDEELHLLTSRAVRWGITDDEFESAIEYAQSPGASLAIPAMKSERMELLRELLQMMAADGVLQDIEKQLFAVAAATMQISDNELNNLLDNMLE